MPRDLFEEYGIEAQSTPAAPRDLFEEYGISDEPASQAKQLPFGGQAFLEAAGAKESDLPVQANKAVMDAALGFGQSLPNTLTGIGNLFPSAVNALMGREVLPMAQPLDIAPHTTSAAIGEIGGLLATPGLVAKGVSSIPKLAKMGSEAMNMLRLSQAPIKQAAVTNALLGAGASPESPWTGAALGGAGGAALGKAGQMTGSENVLTRALGRGALGTAGAGVGYSLGGAPGAAIGFGLGAMPGEATKLLPKTEGSLMQRGKNKFYDSLASFIDSPLSEEEIMQNVAASKGLGTNIGDILQSPTLKRAYENKISKYAGSGAQAEALRTAKAITDEANILPRKYLGDTSPLESGERIMQSLNNILEKETARKNAFYKSAEDQADKVNLKINYPSVLEKAENIDINELPLDKSLRAFVKNIATPPRVERKLTYQNPLTGKKTYQEASLGPSPYSLKDANIKAGELSRLANQYGASADPKNRGYARELGAMARALKNDIRTSIKNSKDSELIGKFNKAEENYKKEFSPFLEKDIYKFAHRQSEQSQAELGDKIVSSFFKANKNTDEAAKLSKLIDKLPQQEKDLFKYAIIERFAEGPEGQQIINPQKLAKFWKSKTLGPKQKKALFSPDERKFYDNLVKKVELNDEALNIMLNVRTGQRNLSLWPQIQGLLAGSLVGTPQALAGMAGVHYGSKIANKLMTGEAQREQIVNALLRKRRLASAAKGGENKTANAITKGLIAAQQKGNNNGD